MEPNGIDIRDVLETLAGFALRGAALLAVVALAMRGMRRRSAALRHGLWTAAIAAQLILPLAALTLPRWPIAMLPPSVENAAPALARIEAGSTAEVVVRGVRAGVAAKASTSHLAPFASDLPRALLMLWLLGTVLLLARRVRAEVRLRRWVAAASPITDPRRALALSQAAATLGLEIPVCLLESKDVAVPLVGGGRPPTILLPPASSTWDTAALRAVLLHELAHVRRGDIRWHLLAHSVRALFWFDPLVWLAVHRMRVEAEQAADDTVLAAGERPSGYAGTLLDLATRATRRAPAVGLALIARSGLGARIEAILARRDRRPLRRGEVIAGALTLVATAGLLAVVEPQPGAATTSSRPARFENEPGAPVRILEAEVQVVPALGGRPGEVRVTRPRLRIENLETRRRISALQLNLETPGLSDDRLWEEVDLPSGKVLDLRLPERIWSHQAPASLAAGVRVGVCGVRFEDGGSWSGHRAGSPRPPARKAGEGTPAPPPTPSPVPPLTPSPAPPAPPAQPTPPAGPGRHLAPTPVAQPDRPRPMGEPISYYDARFENPAGAPLVIEDARTPVFASGSVGMTALPLVTFRNATDRRIVSVRLRFKAGSDAHAVTVLRSPIEPNGTLVYRRDDFELEGDPRRVAIQVLGVRFADGTSWGTLNSSIHTREEWIYPLEFPGRR